MKNKLFLIGSALILLLALGACAPAAAVLSGGESDQPARQITVTGSGMVYVAPDIATITVGVRSTADTVAESLALNNQQAKAIRDVLVQQGVVDEDIQTSSFTVYPQSDYDYQGVVTRTYFAVENNVYVTVRNLDTLSSTLDAVAKSGANNIYGISFDLQDKTKAQTRARELAVESARAQATELARVAGVELGEVVNISSSYSYPMPYYGYGLGGGGGAEAAYAVPISSGQIQVSADVTMVFTIQ